MESVDRERREGEARKDKTKKNTTVAVVNFTPGDRDAKRIPVCERRVEGDYV